MATCSIARSGGGATSWGRRGLWRRCHFPPPRATSSAGSAATRASSASDASHTTPAAAPAAGIRTVNHRKSLHDAAPSSLSASSSSPRVLVIAGPTAVGKTSLSLRMAHALGGEIVSADSVQVYVGLDVGSSKLPEDQRQGVVHHLLDVLHPSREFGAGDFCKHATRAIDDIVRKGKVPIVVARGARCTLHCPRETTCQLEPREFKPSVIFEQTL